MSARAIRSFGVVGVIGVDRDAEARREPQAFAFELEAHRRDRARDALGEHAQHVVGDVRDEDRELVAAQTAEELVAPHLARHLARDPDQHRVARAMAERVVDVLEIVEVEEEQREARAVALRVRDHARELFVEAVAVVEAGQRVALGEIDELLGGLPLVRDVLEQPQVADRAAVHVLHGVPLLRDEASVGHLDLVGPEDLSGAGLAEDMARLVLGTGQHRCCHLHEIVGCAADDARAVGQRPDAIESRVAVDDAVVVRHEEYAHVHRAEQRREPRVLVLRLAEILLLHASANRAARPPSSRDAARPPCAA